MEVDGRLSATRNVDRKSSCCMHGLRNFAEVLSAVLKVDGRPYGHTESRQNLLESPPAA